MQILAVVLISLIVVITFSTPLYLLSSTATDIDHPWRDFFALAVPITLAGVLLIGVIAIIGGFASVSSLIVGVPLAFGALILPSLLLTAAIASKSDGGDAKTENE